MSDTYKPFEEAREAGCTKAVEIMWKVFAEEEMLDEVAYFIRDHMVHYTDDHFLLNEDDAAFFRLKFGKAFNGIKELDEFEQELLEKAQQT